MKRLFGRRGLEPKRVKIVKSFCAYGPSASENEREKIGEMLSSKGITLSIQTYVCGCARIPTTLCVAQNDTEKWITDIIYRRDSCIERWLEYNFNTQDLFPETTISFDNNQALVDIELYLSIIISKLTEKDLPFWCIQHFRFEFVEKFEGTNHVYWALRGVKTTRSLPITSLISYLAPSFQFSVLLLESLFWNSIPISREEKYTDDKRLIWNVE